jgi:molybdopterin-guanine dinucleotide biosynthesis protein B
MASHGKMVERLTAFGIVGASGSGKTTLIERLIPLAIAAGLKTATVKLTHHDLDMDQTGKDSQRHRAAGAGAVALIGPQRTHIIHEAGLDLAEILAQFAHFDLVLIEGFIDAPIPKLEVWRPQLNKPLRGAGKPMMRAIATDIAFLETDLPCLDLNNPTVIFHFILEQMAL